ncbi:MAG: hypothetical protein PHS59_12300 [Paludibacter sp.]|nr:hypothetical protein [Paludibacter sp.]
MKKKVLLLIAIFFSLFVSSQNSVFKDRITLTTGDIYIGDIQLKTNELIIIQTINGAKFQFQLSEVKSIEKVNIAQIQMTDSTASLNESNDSLLIQKNIYGIIEISGSVASAKKLFDPMPNIQLSMIFGSKLLQNKKLFSGLGIGYNNTFISSTSSSISLLPIFIRLQNIFTRNQTSPYVSMDAGYAFALTSGVGGGALVKLSAGISYRINYNTNILIGIYGGVNAIKGNLTETTDLRTFNYYGSTSMNSFGIKAGLQF